MQDFITAPRVEIDHDGAMSNIYTIPAYPDILVKVTPDKNIGNDEFEFYSTIQPPFHPSLLLPFYYRAVEAEYDYKMQPCWELFMERKAGSILRMPKQRFGTPLPLGPFSLESFAGLVTSLSGALYNLNYELRYRHNHVVPKNVVFDITDGRIDFSLIDFSHGTQMPEVRPSSIDQYGLCRVIKYALLGDLDYSLQEKMLEKTYGPRALDIVKSFEWAKCDYTFTNFSEDIINSI